MSQREWVKVIPTETERPVIFTPELSPPRCKEWGSIQSYFSLGMVGADHTFNTSPVEIDVNTLKTDLISQFKFVIHGEKLRSWTHARENNFGLEIASESEIRNHLRRLLFSFEMFGYRVDNLKYGESQKSLNLLTEFASACPEIAKEMGGFILENANVSMYLLYLEGLADDFSTLFLEQNSRYGWHGVEVIQNKIDPVAKLELLTHEMNRFAGIPADQLSFVNKEHVVRGLSTILKAAENEGAPKSLVATIESQIQRVLNNPNIVTSLNELNIFNVDGELPLLNDVGKRVVDQIQDIAVELDGDVAQLWQTALKERSVLPGLVVFVEKLLRPDATDLQIKQTALTAMLLWSQLLWFDDVVDKSPTRKGLATLFGKEVSIESAFQGSIVSLTRLLSQTVQYPHIHPLSILGAIGDTEEADKTWRDKIDCYSSWHELCEAAIKLNSGWSWFVGSGGKLEGLAGLIQEDLGMFFKSIAVYGQVINDIEDIKLSFELNKHACGEDVANRWSFFWWALEQDDCPVLEDEKNTIRVMFEQYGPRGGSEPLPESQRKIALKIGQKNFNTVVKYLLLHLGDNGYGPYMTSLFLGRTRKILENVGVDYDLANKLVMVFPHYVEGMHERIESFVEK